jgi:hypothetical protein
MSLELDITEIKRLVENTNLNEITQSEFTREIFHLSCLPKERLSLVFLDAKGNMIDTKRLDISFGVSEEDVEFYSKDYGMDAKDVASGVTGDTKDVYKLGKERKAKAIYIIHNHPMFTSWSGYGREKKFSEGEWSPFMNPSGGGGSRDPKMAGDLEAAKEFENYFARKGMAVRFFIVAGVNQNRQGTDIVRRPPYVEFDSGGLIATYNTSPDPMDSDFSMYARQMSRYHTGNDKGGYHIQREQ